MEIRIGRFNDLAGVIELHKENLQPGPKGYVSFPLTDDILLEGIQHQTLIVARDSEMVVGYLLALPPESLTNSNFWKPFLQELKNKGLDQERFYVLVQDCIASVCRGRGILEEMYKVLQNELRKQGYSLALSEIRDDNPRSQAAHFRKVGLKIVAVTADEKWIIARWKI